MSVDDTRREDDLWIKTRNSGKRKSLSITLLLEACPESEYSCPSVLAGFSPRLVESVDAKHRGMEANRNWFGGQLRMPGGKSAGTEKGSVNSPQNLGNYQE